MNRVFVSALIALTMSLSAAEADDTSPPIKIGMTTWVGYGLLHLADKMGYFKSNGVDVNLITVQDKPSTAAAIATGRLDGWATTVDTFIFYNAERIGVKQVLAVDYSKGGEGIIAKNDIEKVGDLKGRSIGAEEGSSTYFFLLNLLAENGMTLNDIKLIPMKAGDAGAAFAAGRLDAAATWDPWLSKAAQRGGHILVSTKDKPGLIVDTLAFRADILDKRPEAVQEIIRAYFEAFDEWKTHPDQSNVIMAEALGMKTREYQASLNGIEFVSREQNKTYIGTPTVSGKILGVTTSGIDFYRKLGFLKSGMDAQSVVDPRPLSAVLAK